jgi:hypothetical protein
VDGVAMTETTDARDFLAETLIYLLPGLRVLRDMCKIRGLELGQAQAEAMI